MSAELTVDYIEMNRTTLLVELRRRQAVVRDYVRAVAHGYATGLYLFGRPGTAKTHTVRGVLEEEIREPYVYHRGGLTPVGLFELIAERSDEVIVLDDLVTIFKSDLALQILLSALEHPTGADRNRVVRYRRKGGMHTAAFAGGIVCVSNLELHDGEMLNAFKSRVNTLNYNPGDDLLGAKMLDVAAAGVKGVPPPAAVEVAHYLTAEMLRLGCRFDLRLFFNKAIPSYQQWKDDATESHWKDLVTASIEEHLVAVRHAEADTPETRETRKAAEHALLDELKASYPKVADRVRVWEERTGKSSRAYYRRVAEMQ